MSFLIFFNKQHQPKIVYSGVCSTTKRKLKDCLVVYLKKMGRVELTGHINFVHIPSFNACPSQGVYE